MSQPERDQRRSFYQTTLYVTGNSAGVTNGIESQPQMLLLLAQTNWDEFDDRLFFRAITLSHPFYSHILSERRHHFIQCPLSYQPFGPSNLYDPLCNVLFLLSAVPNPSFFNLFPFFSDQSRTYPFIHPISYPTPSPFSHFGPCHPPLFPLPA